MGEFVSRFDISISPDIIMFSGFKAVCPTGVLDRNSILEMYDMPMKTAIRLETDLRFEQTKYILNT